jgi:hypothetical protein
MNDDSDTPENDVPTDVLLVEIDRSRRNEPGTGDVLRVLLRSFKGRRYVDVRQFWTPPGETERRPGRGTSIRVHELRQVIEALQQAQAELGGERPGISGASFGGRRARDSEPRQAGVPRGSTEPRRASAQRRTTTIEKAE